MSRRGQFHPSPSSPGFNSHIEEIGDSYANIFRKRTREPPVPYISLKDFLTDRNTQNCPEYPKLSDETRNKLEADLTLDELGKALKNLNNGSSPGLDGFCAGWLNVSASLGSAVWRGHSAGSGQGSSRGVQPRV